MNSELLHPPMKRMKMCLITKLNTKEWSVICSFLEHIHLYYTFPYLGRTIYNHVNTEECRGAFWYMMHASWFYSKKCSWGLLTRKRNIDVVKRIAPTIKNLYIGGKIETHPYGYSDTSGWISMVKSFMVFFTNIENLVLSNTDIDLNVPLLKLRTFGVFGGTNIKNYNISTHCPTLNDVEFDYESYYDIKDIVLNNNFISISVYYRVIDHSEFNYKYDKEVITLDSYEKKDQWKAFSSFLHQLLSQNKHRTIKIDARFMLVSLQKPWLFDNKISRYKDSDFMNYISMVEKTSNVYLIYPEYLNIYQNELKQQINTLQQTSLILQTIMDKK